MSKKEQKVVTKGESSKLIGMRWTACLLIALLGIIVVVGVIGFVKPMFTNKLLTNNLITGTLTPDYTDSDILGTSDLMDKADYSDSLVEGATVSLDDLGIEYTGEGDVKIESITPESTKTVEPPSLNRAIVVPNNFSAEANKIVTENITKHRAELKTDPLSAVAWFDLGLQYKIINDYDGAREIWLYLHKVLPTQSITAINLGNTYLQDYKNYTLAEQYYLEGLERNQNCSMCYTGLYELYKYAYKTDTSSAEKILLKGISTMPDNVDFLIMLAVHYKDTQQKQKAIEYYNKALAMHVLKDNPALKSALELEIKSLQ